MVIQQLRQIIMSSESGLSSVSSSADRKARVESIWKSINNTKNISQINQDSRGPSPDRSLKYNRPQQSFSRSTRPNQPQHHLKENLAHLLQKYKEVEKENQFFKNEVERVRREGRDELEGQRRDYEARLKRQLKKLATAEKENACDNQGEKYRNEQLCREVDRLNLKIQGLEHEKKTADAELARLQQLTEGLQQKSKNQETSEWLSHQVKGEQLLELSQARNTIDRLLQLLKKTQQFREIVPLLEQGKGLHYLKSIVKKVKAGQVVLPQSKKTCTCATKISEKLLWTPAQCYRLLLNLKLKHDYLNEDCIQEVLFEMNKIYGSRQEKRVGKLKDHYENEIKLLKRKFQESYDQLLAKKQINRLKKELKAAKSAKKSRPVKLDELRSQGQVEDELKLKLREIKLLQERVRLLQTESGFTDKTLYWQGAIWMVDRVLADIQDSQGELKQFQVTFRDRLDSNLQPQDWLHSYKEFFERLAEMNSGLVEKLLSIKQSALKKIAQ